MDYFSFIQGIKLGIVTSLDDPDKQNRVKVNLTAEDIEVGFCPVASFSAGNSYGNVCIPEVGQQVILGFINGNLSTPIVLGSLYNAKNKPHLSIDTKKNEVVSLKFKAGLTIDVNNKGGQNNIVTITTKKGHILSLDDEKETLDIKNKQGNTSMLMEFSKGTIDLKAQNKITMSAGQESFALEANKGLTITSNAGTFKADFNNLDFKAKANATLSGNAKATIKAGMIDINANGVASLKGNVTKLG